MKIGKLPQYLEKEVQLLQHGDAIINDEVRDILKNAKDTKEFKGQVLIFLNQLAVEVEVLTKIMIR